MNRVIDFDVSVAGLPQQIIRVEYKSQYSTEDIDPMRHADAMRKTFNEAIDALKKEIGHGDFEIVYWYWIK